jgi:hypothetical protein
MPSTYTLNNGIELIGTGEQSGTWGDTTNTNLGLLDAALDGQVTITLAAAGSSGSPNALPITDGTASNGRNRMVVFADGGDLGATAYVQLTPNDAEKIIYIRNSLSGSRSVILFQGTYNASNDYEVPAGTTAVVYFDGAGAGAVAANVFNNAYFDGLRLGSVSVTAILDEDNMASDSATALATQQSIKAYVDSQVGTVDTLAEILAIGNTTGATDIAVDSAQKVQFRDAAIYINSSVDGQLDIVADTEIQIAATTIDVNGALDVSGTALVTGVLTTTAATVSNGGGQFNGAINVGVDDTGYDVKFFGATAGAYMLWDESADDLILGGAAGLSVNSTALVTGVLTTTAATVFNGGFAANVGSTITTADNTSQLTLISTDADASGGPVLDFFRNSASPADGDDTGQIRLQGKNDAGETISYVSMGSQIADMTDGTEDGKFYINTVLGGSNVSRIYMTDTETIFNDSASDLDFRVESDNNTHALYVDGENGNVGINSTATNARLEVVATSGEVFRADANGGAYRVVVNQTGVNMNGLVGIGTTNPVSQFAVGAAGRRIEIDGGYVIRGFDRTASWAGIDFEASAYTFDCSTARMLDIAATGVIINEDGADADFRVESNALTNAFVIDGGNSGIGFGATPRSDLHASWTQLFVGKKGSILSERDTAGGIAQMSITDNLYMDSDTGSYAYIETDQASQYVQNAGVHTFNHAVSGSAGAAPTFIVQAQFADDEAVFNNGCGANIDM